MNDQNSPDGSPSTRSPASKPVDNDKMFDRLVDLIIEQNRTAQSWAGKYIAIQGGLGVAVGAVLKLGSRNADDFVFGAVLVISAVAIVLALVLGEFVIRNTIWQSAFITQAKALDGRLIGDQMVQGGMKLRTVMKVTEWTIVAAWAVFGLMFATNPS